MGGGVQNTLRNFCTFSNLVIFFKLVKRKDGRVRLCADYSTGLNDALEPHQYPLPTPEAIFAKLAGFTMFSLIDFSEVVVKVILKIQMTLKSRDFDFGKSVTVVTSAPASLSSITISKCNRCAFHLS